MLLYLSLVNMIINFEQLMTYIRLNKNMYLMYNANDNINILLDMYTNNMLSEMYHNYIYIVLSYSEKKEILILLNLDISQINIIQNEIDNINNNLHSNIFINNNITNIIINKWKNQLINRALDIILVKYFILYNLYNPNAYIDIDINIDSDEEIDTYIDEHNDFNAYNLIIKESLISIRKDLALFL